MTPSGWFRVRLGCAAASAGVFAFAVIVIGSLTPGYDQWSDAVSRLASPGERWALAARAAFAAYGLLVVAGASTLRRYAGRRGHTLARCLTLYGLACVIAGAAPKDQPGAAHTTVSQLHVAAAVLAGTLAIGAMTLVSRCGLTRATRRTAVAMALLTGLAAGIFKYTWGPRCTGSANEFFLALACAGSPRSPPESSWPRDTPYGSLMVGTASTTCAALRSGLGRVPQVLPVCEDNGSDACGASVRCRQRSQKDRPYTGTGLPPGDSAS
jgi:hypothetical protein